MGKLVLTQTRFQGGLWEGVLEGATAAPEVEVRHLDRALDGVTLAPLPGREGCYALAVPVPAEVLGEGVQTFVIRSDGVVLGTFAIAAGAALVEDLRADLDLMRAELDLLKAAFRRHCAES